ncbi:hypothetical protein [Comamonas testosteroni]|uniref:hypothetical protein n=1 Tax=Comamonas testosteroni TaxID=285 RepID=UPI0026EE5D36|nr:hypothetical protein [Comamonas testosteroni]WQD42162.1 hypothetical protein U0024_20890 [Comamonas testosteroni]
MQKPYEDLRIDVVELLTQLSKYSEDLRRAQERAEDEFDNQRSRYELWQARDDIRHDNVPYDEIPGHEEMQGLETVLDDAEKLEQEIRATQKLLDSISSDLPLALTQAVVSATDDASWRIGEIIKEFRERVRELANR